MSVCIRVGLPLPGGALPRAARRLGAKVLVSANALARRRDGDVVGFRTQLPDLDGLDVALDSAGFVAWAHYGGFPWSVEMYVGELVAGHPWTWWAQMDACCEPEMAGDRVAVRMRQAETIRLLGECEAVARRFGVAPPVPVLQGWTPDDYVWHAREIGLHVTDRAEGRAWMPDLVGVGSMCRRQTFGPNGLVAVVAALDRVLPTDVGLHLFGVKSEGLALLARHPRVASVDSMAWDVAARNRARDAGVSCSMAHRSAVMGEWYATQMAAVGRLEMVPGALALGSGEPPVHELVDEYADLLAAGEIDAGSAGYHLAWETCWNAVVPGRAQGWAA